MISNEEFKEKRLYPIVFYGETSRKGNRFFDFKELSEGKILFIVSFKFIFFFSLSIYFYLSDNFLIN